MKHSAANKDKQNLDYEANQQATKAGQFINSFKDIAKREFKHFNIFLSYFEKLILSIEVASHNGNKDGTQYIYFPKHPLFNFLAADTRDNIILNVEWGTPRDKLISLLGFREDIYSEIQLNYTLKYRTNYFMGVKMGFPITS